MLFQISDHEAARRAAAAQKLVEAEAAAADKKQLEEALKAEKDQLKAAKKQQLEQQKQEVSDLDELLINKQIQQLPTKSCYIWFSYVAACHSVDPVPAMQVQEK